MKRAKSNLDSEQFSLAALKAEKAELAARMSKVEKLIAACEDYAMEQPARDRPRQTRKTKLKNSAANILHLASHLVGLGLPEASAKQLLILSPNQEPRHSSEIWKALSAAGFKTTSQNPERAVAWSLRKREKKPGDVLLIGNGMWVHTSWLTEAQKEEYRKNRGYHAGRNRVTHSEKTRLGMEVAAKTRGVRFGAKRKMTPEILDSVERMLLAQRKVGDVAAEFKVSKATIYGFFTIGRRNGMQTVERRDAARSKNESQSDLLTPMVDRSVH